MAFDKSKFIPRFLEEGRGLLTQIHEGTVHLASHPDDQDMITETCRSAHTIKGSAKIVGLPDIARVAFKLEELFQALKSEKIRFNTDLSKLIQESAGVLSELMNRVERGEDSSTETTTIEDRLEQAAQGVLEQSVEPESDTETSAEPVATETKEEPSPPQQTPQPDTQDTEDAEGTPSRRGGTFNKGKFLQRFVEDAREHIDSINEGLVNLETQPGNLEILGEIFRSSHTLKGASKILGLKSVSALAHKVEDALDALRANRIDQTKELCDLLFQSVDLLTEFVEQLSEGNETTGDIEPYTEALEKAARGEAFDLPETAGGTELTATETQSKTLAPAGAPTTDPGAPPPTSRKAASSETIRIHTDKLDETVKLMGEIVSNHIRMKQNLVDIDDIQKQSRRYLDTLVNLKTENKLSANGSTEDILEMARGLHGMIRQLSAHNKDVMNFQTLLTDELRERVLKMRMLPLSTVLDTFPRLVRDLSNTCGKQVRFIVEGGETELDKKIVERIGDPLLHMIRNSIDHGIESPEDRQAAGKAPAGTLKVTAEYEGGNVLITLEDDGRGIPVDRVREKAIQKKMYDEETIRKMSDSEVINLIFQPGFSTSQMITDVSGRGVGMDVVKDNIVKLLKGSVQIDTREGKGTTFFIRLPLTLAVMRVMLVTTSGYQAAFPLNAVREIVRVPESALIEVVNRRAISLRDQIVPVAPLDKLLGLPNQGEKDSRAGDERVILMVAMGTEMLGLMVDGIVTEEDMEIKALPPHMKNNELVSGVTLSGKNEIVLVLHVPKLFTLAREIDEGLGGSREPAKGVAPARILIVDDSVSTRDIEQSILESHGYQVDTARDGVEAYEMCQERSYDLVITDIEMPRMDGFSLTEHLRQVEAYRHTPVIIVSSLSRDEDKRRGMEVGADAYIVKGAFDQTNLITTIQSLVG